MNKERIIAGLDLGTTKICAIIGEVISSEEVRVIGVETVPSYGINKGVVVNIDQTAEAIREAVEGAEKLAGVHVSSLYTGIAGSHIQGFNRRGIVAVSQPDKGITDEDINRVLTAAKAITMPDEREIIHVLPQGFTVDDQPGIKDPTGMSGGRLEAQVHIVTAMATAVKNINKSVTQANRKVKELILQPLASGYAVCSPDEMGLGVAVLDIGGGTTDIALFSEGALQYTAVVGLGGRNVTNDIAIGLRTPLDQAEEIKKKHGCALVSMADAKEKIRVPMIGRDLSREVSRELLASIIQPRMEEILEFALQEIKRSDYAELLPAGIVLTGGGAMLAGSAQLAEQLSGMPVKIGTPRGVTGLTDIVQSPICSTAIGLLRYPMSRIHRKTEPNRSSLGSPGVFNRIKQWLSDFL